MVRQIFISLALTLGLTLSLPIMPSVAEARAAETSIAAKSDEHGAALEPAIGDETESAPESPPEETYIVPFRKKALNFGLVYTAQWAVYVITQYETIREHGSFDNFIKYSIRPHFDRDHFDYNIIKHTLSGQYYYLFYRSQGYDVKEAFISTFASSLAFEFAVETVTERPSIQDIYQTPVFGTIAGMAFDQVSHEFISSPHRALRIVGYVLNPFRLLPDWSSQVAIIPSLDSQTKSLNLVAEF